MFCPNCGFQVPDNGIFCPKCGVRLANTPDATAPPVLPSEDTAKQNPSFMQKTTIDPTYAPIFSFTGLFSPKGRRSRSKAWGVGLFLIAVFIVSIVIDNVVLERKAGPLCFSIVFLLSAFIGTTNLIKRLHDINRSGYWILALYGCGLLFALLNALINPSSRPASQPPSNFKSIPLIFDLLWIIGHGYILTKSGTVGPNQYGPDPTEKPIQPSSTPTEQMTQESYK